MLKANNPPYKKFLGLVFSWVNVVKNYPNLSKKNFSLNNINLGAHFFVIDIFRQLQILKHFIF